MICTLRMSKGIEHDFSKSINVRKPIGFWILASSALYWNKEIFKTYKLNNSNKSNLTLLLFLVQV